MSRSWRGRRRHDFVKTRHGGHRDAQRRPVSAAKVTVHGEGEYLAIFIRLSEAKTFYYAFQSHGYASAAPADYHS